MRTFKLLQGLVLALPFMIGAGCGGIDDLLGVDGGTDMSGNVCGNTQLFAVGSGTYTIQTVSNLQDGCGLQPNGLMGLTREVVYDSAKGVVTLKGDAGRPDFGSGAVKCNVGLLTLPATADTNAGCSYTLTRESQLTLTAASTFTVKFKETQSMKGAGCNPKADCVTTFDMVWKR